MVDYREFFERHGGKVVGVVVGLCLGWFVVVLWKAMLVVGCALAGFYFGSRVDKRVEFGHMWRRLFREK